jgi:hypothetical protein
MSDIRERVMGLFHALRYPKDKPEGTQILDERLDVVEKRLKVLSPDGANKAQHVLQAGRR